MQPKSGLKEFELVVFLSHAYGFLLLVLTNKIGSKCKKIYDSALISFPLQSFHFSMNHYPSFGLMSVGVTQVKTMNSFIALAANVYDLHVTMQNYVYGEKEMREDNELTADLTDILKQYSFKERDHEKDKRNCIFSLFLVSYKPDRSTIMIKRRIAPEK